MSCTKVVKEHVIMVSFKSLHTSVYINELYCTAVALTSDLRGASWPNQIRFT